MDFTPIQQIADGFGCRMLYNEPLSKHTTMRVGGACDAMILPHTLEALSAILHACNVHNIKYFVLGNGSNTLFCDTGISGLVILLNHNFSRIWLENETELVCEAGASLSAVCKFAYDNALTGLEFAYGIPGSIGGAVYMNAGAYGGQMSDVVQSCIYVANDGTCEKINAEQMQFSYRHSAFCKGGCAIAQIRLHLSKGDPAKIKERMDTLMEKRTTKQPLDYPSAGSTFKRPEGSYASLLIDQCGLKGTCVGGAQVSEKHAGFIINKDNATTSDILALVEVVKEQVKAQTGFSLECEVQIVED